MVNDGKHLFLDLFDSFGPRNGKANALCQWLDCSLWCGWYGFRGNWDGSIESSRKIQILAQQMHNTYVIHDDTVSMIFLERRQVNTGSMSHQHRDCWVRSKVTMAYPLNIFPIRFSVESSAAVTVLHKTFWWHWLLWLQPQLKKSGSKNAEGATVGLKCIKPQSLFTLRHSVLSSWSCLQSFRSKQLCSTTSRSLIFQACEQVRILLHTADSGRKGQGPCEMHRNATYCCQKKCCVNCYCMLLL